MISKLIVDGLSTIVQLSQLFPNVGVSSMEKKLYFHSLTMNLATHSALGRSGGNEHP